MKIKYFLFTISVLIFSANGIAQEPASEVKKRITEKDFVEGQTYSVDTIINGKTYYKQNVLSSTHRLYY